MRDRFRRGAAKLPVTRIGARDTRYRPAMARRTAAARLCPLPLCPHFCPADARSDTRRERLTPPVHASPPARSRLRISWPRRSRGASHASASAPLGARVLRGKP